MKQLILTCIEAINCTVKKFQGCSVRIKGKTLSECKSHNVCLFTSRKKINFFVFDLNFSSLDFWNIYVYSTKVTELVTEVIDILQK